jgi:hypothetical protein
MTVNPVSIRNDRRLRGAIAGTLLVAAAAISWRAASTEARFALAASSPPAAGAALIAEGGAPLGLRTRLDALNACLGWLASPRFPLLLDAAPAVAESCDAFAAATRHGGRAEAELVRAAVAMRRERVAEIGPRLIRSRAAAPNDAWLAARRLEIAATLDAAALDDAALRAALAEDLRLVARGWRHLAPIGRLMAAKTPLRDLALETFEDADPDTRRRISGAIARSPAGRTPARERGDDR